MNVGHMAAYSGARSKEYPTDWPNYIQDGVWLTVDRDIQDLTGAQTPAADRLTHGEAVALQVTRNRARATRLLLSDDD